MTGKTQNLDTNFTPLLFTHPLKKRFRDWLRLYNKIKNNLLTNFVSVEERKVFFKIALFFSCDPFKIFRVPLLGRDPAVEKPCSRLQATRWQSQRAPNDSSEQDWGFGVHCKSYYSLEVSYFKSVMDKRLLDSLWNQYWVNTLSSSSLITNAEHTTFTYVLGNFDLVSALNIWLT